MVGGEGRSVGEEVEMDMKEGFRGVEVEGEMVGIEDYR